MSNCDPCSNPRRILYQNRTGSYLSKKSPIYIFPRNSHPSSLSKDKVGNGIEFCSKTIITVCLSCNSSVYHITKTAEEIYDVKL